MSIDLFAEEDLLTLTEAAKALPRRRRGRPVSPCTLWRWYRSGLRGVRLEVVKVGGQTMTSRQALQRFFDRLTAAANPSCIAATPAARQRAMDAAERELDAAGI